MSQITISFEDVTATNAGRTIKIAHFTGQLDESNVDEKAKEIYDVIQKTSSPFYFIFDFAGLEYMNSKSIGYLTDWYTKLSEKQGNIVIAQARPNIVDILSVVGITQLIKSVSTLEEAKLAANS